MALPNLNNKDTGLLEDLVESQVATVNTIGDGIQIQLDSLSEISDILQDQYQEQLAFRAEQRAAAEEARREALNKLVPEKKEEKTGGPFKGDSTSSFGSLAILAGLFASLTGLDDVIRTIQLPKAIASFSAVLKPLTDSFKNFTKSISVSVLNSRPFQAIKNFFEPFFKFLENTKKSLSSFRPASFTKAQSTFKSVGNFMRGVLKFLDTARIYIGVLSLEAFEKAQKAFKSFADFMKPVTNFLVSTGKVLMKSDIVAGALNAASRAVSRFTGFLSPVLNFFKGTSQIAGPISKIMPILKLGTGVFLRPILSVIDFVQGFMKGYSGENGSILKGLFFGLTEVFKGIFTYPADLIKSGISWLLGKLGFKVAEDALDSFTFSGGVDRFVEGITDDPLGMIAKVVMLPYDLIKGGISWVLGKLGFKGGAEALDNFSFGDTFGSLIKGDFDLFGKVSKFFSDIGDGISKIFGFIPSMKEIKAAILNSLPDWALEGLDMVGLLDDDAKNLLEVRSKSKEIAEKQKEIEELEAKKENAKGAPGVGGFFKKSKEEVQAEIDEEIAEKKKMLEKDRAELRQARGRVYVDKISADERTDEQLRAEVRDNSLGSIRFEALQEQAKSTNADIRADAPERLAEANRKREEAEKILRARELRAKEKVERLEKEQAMKKAEGQIIQELGDGNISIGEAKYRRLKESQKDSLKNSLVNDNEKTGAALDAAAAAQAANQNQQVNVVSAPQTDASTTNNIQTTNVAPGAAMARNPDSSYRMGTFRAL